MTYGERIRQEREARGLTQEELAEALGVSRQAVSKWEGDLSRPAAGKLILLSETLEIPRDAWRTMDAEEAAVQAAAQETAGERKAKRWRKASPPWRCSSACPFWATSSSGGSSDRRHRRGTIPTSALPFRRP